MAHLPAGGHDRAVHPPRAAQPSARSPGGLAGAFASLLGLASEGSAAGRLHDLGKYRVEFQEYLRQQRKAGTDIRHAIFGAGGRGVTWRREMACRAIPSAYACGPSWNNLWRMNSCAHAADGQDGKGLPEESRRAVPDDLRAVVL